MGKNIIISGMLFQLLFFTAYLHAQVGIGTANPDTSTILDIRSSTKGVLIPRMTEFQRSKITETADGLLVQDLHTGKTVTNRNNYGQWGVIDPVINQNVNFTAFFTAGAVHVLNFDPGLPHQWTTFTISGPLLGVCSSDNLIVFVTQTHVNVLFEDGNKVVQLRTLAFSSGPVVDMGVTGNSNATAVILKGNTAYQFRQSTGSWTTTNLSTTPANLRVLSDRIIFTAGTSAFFTTATGLQSSAISGSRAAIYANSNAAIIHTTTNLYSFIPLISGGMEILTNTLASGVTNVFDNGQRNRIVVQSTDKLRVLSYEPGGTGVWSSINITGPVDKVVAADKF